MSTDQSDTSEGIADRLPDTLDHGQQQLLEYLISEVETEGQIYTKSRFIANELDLSPKQIGVFMQQLQEYSLPISIEQWGYSNGTTWRVWKP